MNSENAAAAARAICQTAPVIPVLVIHDLAHARPLAEALVAGGLPCLEVTLRTDCALAAIEAMAAVPRGKARRRHPAHPGRCKIGAGRRGNLWGQPWGHGPVAGGGRGRRYAPPARGRHRQRSDAAAGTGL